MKNFVFLYLAFLILNGCASNTPKSTVAESNTFLETYPEADVKEAAGKTASVEMNVSNSSAHPDLVASLALALKEKGYQIVENPVDAYIHITAHGIQQPLNRIFASHFSDIPPDQLVNLKWQEETPFKKQIFKFNGPANTMMESVSIRIDLQSYGKRPLRIASGRLTGPADGSVLKSESLNNLIHFIAYQIPNPGKQVLELKKRPGCVPRFGMEYSDDTELPNVVSQIHKNSPAAKSGLKIGDQVLAIETYDLEEMITAKGSAEIDKIYESQKLVPVKVKRGKEILYLKMKADIMCHR